MHSSGKVSWRQILEGSSDRGGGHRGRCTWWRNATGKLSQQRELVKPEHSKVAVGEANQKHTLLWRRLKNFGKKRSLLQTRKLKLLSSLNHSNIIKIEEVFCGFRRNTKKITYVLMQYHLELMDLFKLKEISISGQSAEADHMAN